MASNKDDSASAKGVFGWAKVDGVDIPYLLRSGTKYVCVRMVETKLLSKFPNTYPEEVAKRPPLVSLFITSNEAKLLNEINTQHCASVYGRKEFTKKRDLIVALKDFEDFYNIVKKHYVKTGKPIPDPAAAPKKRASRPPPPVGGGWVQVNNTVVPYVFRVKTKFVPLSVIRYAAGLLTDVSVQGQVPTAEECQYLNETCKTAGLNFKFEKATKLLALNLVRVLNKGESSISELPKADPFGHAQAIYGEEYEEDIPPTQPPGPSVYPPLYYDQAQSMASQVSPNGVQLPLNLPSPVNTQWMNAHMGIYPGQPVPNATSAIPSSNVLTNNNILVNLNAAHQNKPPANAQQVRRLSAGEVPKNLQRPAISPHLPMPANMSYQGMKPDKSNPAKPGYYTGQQQSLPFPPPNPFEQQTEQTSKYVADSGTSKKFRDRSSAVISQTLDNMGSAGIPMAPPSNSSRRSSAESVSTAGRPTPPPPVIQKVIDTIQPVEFMGKTLSCLMRGGKRYALIEAMWRVYFSYCTLEEFHAALESVLRLPPQQLTKEEEAAFISFYRLPTDTLQCNKVVQLEEFQLHMSQLAYMLHDDLAQGTRLQNKGRRSRTPEQMPAAPAAQSKVANNPAAASNNVPKAQQNGNVQKLAASAMAHFMDEINAVVKINNARGITSGSSNSKQLTSSAYQSENGEMVPLSPANPDQRPPDQNGEVVPLSTASTNQADSASAALKGFLSRKRQAESQKNEQIKKKKRGLRLEDMVSKIKQHKTVSSSPSLEVDNADINKNGEGEQSQENSTENGEEMQIEDDNSSKDDGDQMDIEEEKSSKDEGEGMQIEEEKKSDIDRKDEVDHIQIEEQEHTDINRKKEEDILQKDGEQCPEADHKEEEDKLQTIDTQHRESDHKDEGETLQNDDDSNSVVSNVGDEGGLVQIEGEESEGTLQKDEGDHLKIDDQNANINQTIADETLQPTEDKALESKIKDDGEQMQIDVEKSKEIDRKDEGELLVDAVQSVDTDLKEDKEVKPGEETTVNNTNVEVSMHNEDEQLKMECETIAQSILCNTKAGGQPLQIEGGPSESKELQTTKDQESVAASVSDDSVNPKMDMNVLEAVVSPELNADKPEKITDIIAPEINVNHSDKATDIITPETEVSTEIDDNNSDKASDIIVSETTVSPEQNTDNTDKDNIAPETVVNPEIDSDNATDIIAPEAAVSTEIDTNNSDKASDIIASETAVSLEQNTDDTDKVTDIIAPEMVVNPEIDSDKASDITDIIAPENVVNTEMDTTNNSDKSPGTPGSPKPNGDKAMDNQDECIRKENADPNLNNLLAAPTAVPV